MTDHARFALALLIAALALVTRPAEAQPSFINFESGQVRPMAMSADGSALYVVNTPDARLEVFDLTGGTPALVDSIGVGLEPVAVAVESATRVWVVNHLSDSVSIVDVGAAVPHVVRTLLVGDEPRDIVFAGAGFRRAFITTAHRGQASPTPRGEFRTPGIGRADVWVFDADALGSAPEIVTLFGDVPRALAVSPDGSRVYAAVFFSGNRTTALSEGVVCNGGPSAPACTVGGVSYPGGLPAPFANHAGAGAPEVGLIVRQLVDDGPWLDELGRDWSNAVRFELPDEDVFAIDATATPPVEVDSFTGVGTINFGMATHPSNGDLYVANTEALNEIRFEGPGTLVSTQNLRPGLPPTVRGHLHEARVTRITGSTVTPVHLNPHIDYADSEPAEDVRWRTLALPTAIAFSADGATAYVTGLGTSAIAVLPTSELEAGTVGTDPSRMIHLRDPYPGGPTGLVLDEARDQLYVLTRFDNSVVTVDLTSRTPRAQARMHTPEPEAVVVGRPVLYDSLLSSSNGESSCASCHVFGDNDGLAWDLGDPDGDVLTNPNPSGVIGSSPPFHPMKGPMTTQSLRGMDHHGPMHWRGDRTAGHSGGDPLDERNAFVEFNVAFEGLLGRAEGPLLEPDMGRFADFVMTIEYPPNPIRQLDNSLRADEARGEDIYFNRNGIDSITTCNGCHTLDRAQGFFGGDGRSTFENEPQEFKVAHLRNAYTKVGMFGMPLIPFLADPGSPTNTGPQVRGFGFLHDGSIDTALRFFHAGVFTGFNNETEREDIEAFVMAFDSTLAPIVGQQVTIESAQTARATLLVERAAAPLMWPGGATVTECELIVRGLVDGERRGYLLEGNAFESDRVGEPAIAPLDMLTLASQPGNALTATCVPPGSGQRMGYDRDEDGIRDGDERDAASDPASRPTFTIPAPDIPGRPVPDVDAGPPDLDAGTPSGDAGPGLDAGPGPDAGAPGSDSGAVDAGSSVDGGVEPPPADGCGCRASGPTTGGPGLLFALAALAFVRRRRLG